MNWSFLYDHTDDNQHDQHVWEWKFWREMAACGYNP